MRKIIIKILLWLLNNPLRSTPCQYALVNNLEVFGDDFLRNEVRLDPQKTIHALLTDTLEFKACAGKEDGLWVMQNGTMREASEKDIEELKHLS